jgi:prepilin-type N-terminal cleavage/methylation domain-containing protein
VEEQVYPHNRDSMRGFSLVELLIVSTVMLVVLGIISAIVQSVQRNYAQQRPRIEAVSNASAAMDMMVRIILTSGNNPNNIASFPSTATPAIVPAANSIRIRSDWNPADGDLADPYEDVEFSTANGVLRKQERSIATPDAQPVPYLDNIESLTFTYLDVNGNVTASGNAVARVGIILTTRTPDGNPMTFTSAASVRRLER